MLERRGILVLAVICACTACPPLRQPPDSLLAAFTLNHTVPLEFYYVDDSNKGNGTHYKYSQSDINQLIREAESFIQQALSVNPPSPPSTISSTTWRTHTTDIWLVHALQQHSVAGHTAIGPAAPPNVLWL
jgi:hypothetical protein